MRTGDSVIPNVEYPDTTRYSPVKLCTDISEKDDGVWGVGVVAKNHNGARIAANRYLLGKGFESHEAELQAIEEVVIAARRSNIDHAIILSDCAEAVETAHEYGFHKMFETGRIVTVDREANVQAHYEARRAVGKA